MNIRKRLRQRGARGQPPRWWWVVCVVVGVVVGLVGNTSLMWGQTSQPDDGILPQMVNGTVAVDIQVERAVRHALAKARSTMPEAEHYAISNIQAEGNWLFVSVVGLRGLKSDQQWNLLDNSVWVGLVLLQKDEDEGWVSATEGTQEFSQLLNDIPDNVVSATAKRHLDPLQRHPIPMSGYIFPWDSGTCMWYGSRGVHDNGFEGIVNGWKAVDFVSDGNTGEGRAPNRLRAAASGTIGYVCNGPYNVAIRIGDLMYTHLVHNDELETGNYFPQRDELGQLKQGTIPRGADPCGYADQGSTYFHVHWGFPSSGVLNVEDWTLNLSDGLWRRGTETRGINYCFTAGGGSSPPPTTAPPTSPPPTVGPNTPLPPTEPPPPTSPPYTPTPADYTDPEVWFVETPPPYGASRAIRFEWQGWDNRTDEDDIEYRYELDDDWSSWKEDKTDKSYSSMSDGEHKFRVQAKDEAGNRSDKIAYEFIIDASPPSISFINPPSGYYDSASVNFQWRGSDGFTPDDEIQYRWKLDDAAWSGWATGVTNHAVSSLAEGAHKFQLQAQDELGNQSAAIIASFIVDTMPPTATFVLNRGSDLSFRSTVPFTATAHDAGSGVDVIRFSYDGVEWGEWLPFGRYGDNALGRNPYCAITDTLLLYPLHGATHIVYFQVRDRAGHTSDTLQDSVQLNFRPPKPRSDNYRIWTDVVASTGGVVTTTNHAVKNTLGQAVECVNPQSDNYHISSCFWGGFPAEPLVEPQEVGYGIAPKVVASAGGHHASPQYRLNATLGQFDETQQMSTSQYALSSGFWAQITGTVGPAIPQPIGTRAPTATPGPSPTPSPTPYPRGVAIAEGAYTNQPTITLLLQGGPAREMLVSAHNDFAGTDWTAYEPSCPLTLTIAADELSHHTAYARYRDADELEYGDYTDNIIYEPFAPTGAVEIQLTGQPTVVLLLSAEDEHSGVAWMRLGNSSAEVQAAEWITYTPTASWTLGAEDTAWVQYQDRAGNISDVYSDTIDSACHGVPEATLVITDNQCIGYGVAFADLSTVPCAETYRLLEFGDGYSSTETDTYHFYLDSGTYPVTLTIATADTVDIATDTVTVLPAPSAEFTVTVDGMQATFTALDSSATLYEWNFGDEMADSGRIVTHEYSAGGTYIVSLVTSDERCSNGYYRVVEIADGAYQIYLPVILKNHNAG